MKYIYNKLVRDKIPENINSMEGRNCNYKILNDKEYLEELDKKIFEEAHEFIEEHSVEELADLADPFIVSTSLVNLQRLGLIRITERGLSGAHYEGMKEHPYVLERKEIFNQFGREFSCEVNQRAVLINNYGEQFARVCLQKNI